MQSKINTKTAQADSKVARFTLSNGAMKVTLSWVDVK